MCCNTWVRWLDFTESEAVYTEEISAAVVVVIAVICNILTELRCLRIRKLLYLRELVLLRLTRYHKSQYSV